MLRRDRIYCDGRWRPSEGSGAIEVVDPATEEVVATVPEGRAADVDAAVDAAVRALPLWSAASPAERARHLRAVTDGLLARRAELSRTITTELGMPLAQSDAVQVGMALTTFASMAELAACPPPEERLGHSVVVREPVGVVGAITPWNYPLQQIAAKVAAALAAGCTVVLKPSEVAPLNAFLLADVVDRAGLPPGVFNLVCGVGPVVGEAIASHPAVDMVSFTGSTRAGRRVAALAAETVKRVALELGGKSPALLLDDADLESAVPALVAAAYANSGQACSALTRLLVPADRLAEVEDLAVQAARSYQVGDPFAQETDLGPVVSAVQRDRVRGYIVRGVDEGARLLTGGPEPPAGVDRGD